MEIVGGVASIIVSDAAKYAITSGALNDMDLYVGGKFQTVTALRIVKDGEETVQPVGQQDMVYFTNDP